MPYAAGINNSAPTTTWSSTTFNPYYLASLNLAITQPLLKNAGMNAVKRPAKAVR